MVAGLTLARWAAVRVSTRYQLRLILAWNGASCMDQRYRCDEHVTQTENAPFVATPLFVTAVRVGAPGDGLGGSDAAAATVMIMTFGALGRWVTVCCPVVSENDARADVPHGYFVVQPPPAVKDVSGATVDSLLGEDDEHG